MGSGGGAGTGGEGQWGGRIISGPGAYLCPIPYDSTNHLIQSKKRDVEGATLTKSRPEDEAGLKKGKPKANNVNKGGLKTEGTPKVKAAGPERIPKPPKVHKAKDSEPQPNLPKGEGTNNTQVNPKPPRKPSVPKDLKKKPAAGKATVLIE